MTIASYDDLVQRCQDWLFGRTDIASRVPDFITMFEAKANRKLFCRQMEIRSTATVNLNAPEPEFVPLPLDFQSMRRVRLINTVQPSGGSKPRLKFATGAQMDDLRVMNNTEPGIPIWFAVFGTQMELCPTPAYAFPLEMIYRANIPPLGANTATNWLLAFAPDAYLYGALMEAAPYLANDERIPVWASGVQAAFDDLNKLSDEAEFNAGPLTWRRKGRSYS